MKYFFSIAFISLMFLDSFGQEPGEVQRIYKYKKDKIGFLQVGWAQPFTFGNNFANKGLDVSRGLDFQINIYLQETNLFIGYRYQNLVADVSDPLLVGNYESTSIALNALNFGYFLAITEKLSLKPSISAGFNRYKNKIPQSNVDFRDTGYTAIVSGSLDYKLNEKFSVHLSPEFRADFMNIVTARELDSFFGNAFYFTVNAGVKLNF